MTDKSKLPIGAKFLNGFMGYRINNMLSAIPKSNGTVIGIPTSVWSTSISFDLGDSNNNFYEIDVEMGFTGNLYYIDMKKAGERMSEEVTLLLIKMLEQQNTKIDNLEKKVDELIALKNKVIAGGIILSAIFGFVWDFFKNFFERS